MRHSPNNASSAQALPVVQWAAVLALLLCGTASVAEPAATATAMTEKPFTAPSSADLAFDVKGKVSGFSYSATAKLHWQHDAKTYQVEQSIRAPIIGTRAQKSQGTIAPHYLQPLSFEDSSRNKRNLRFDPDQHTVTIPASSAVQTIPAGAQDRLSVFFQLAGLLAANEDLRQTGQQVPIWTVASNKQEAWVFEVKGAESIQLPVGQLPAIKLERMPRKADDQKAEIWLSPTVAYLPVRIHFEDDGDAVDLLMSGYTFKPAATTP